MRRPIYFLFILCFCSCVMPLLAMEQISPDRELLGFIENEELLTKSIEREGIQDILYHPSIRKLAEILAFKPSEKAITSACEIVNKKKEDDVSMLQLLDDVMQSLECSDEYIKKSQQKRKVCEEKCAVFGMMHELLQGHFKGQTLQDFRSAEESGLLLQ